MAQRAPTFRKVQPSDLARLDQIRRAAFAPIFDGFHAMVGEDIAAVALVHEEDDQRRDFADMCAGSEDNQVYVACTGGQIVGFVTVMLDPERSMGEIGVNAVDPAHGNRGIGTSMFTFALERMREAGMKAAYVGTGSDAGHAPARAAYAKAGFAKSIPGVHLYRTL